MAYLDKNNSHWANVLLKQAISSLLVKTSKTKKSEKTSDLAPTVMFKGCKLTKDHKAVLLLFSSNNQGIKLVIDKGSYELIATNGSLMETKKIEGQMEYFKLNNLSEFINECVKSANDTIQNAVNAKNGKSKADAFKDTMEAFESNMVTAEDVEKLGF